VGSLEYAVEHLHVPLLLILGHTRCGAVTSAVAGGASSANVRWVMKALRPAVRAAASCPGDAVENATREHLRCTASGLGRGSALLRDAIERRGLRVEKALYDLVSGSVEFLA
jgi:carbonic anhydrase